MKRNNIDTGHNLKMMKSIYLLMVLTFFASNSFAQKTVCSATLNSSDEFEIFKKQFRGTDTRFVDLVPDKFEEDKRDWFARACKSGVECDVLVISGHFGGVFFGQSGYRLETDTLENFSCANTCDGILKRPKEVYLFGCNTLSTKEPDSRTPAEYIQALLSHGVRLEMAERLAAIRYTPFGDSNKGRMERVFTNVQNIYGFSSIAPAGVNITDILETYFLHLGNYSDLLDHYTGENTTIGPRNWLDKSFEMNSAVTSGTKGAKWHEHICELLSPRTTRLQKFIRINELLNSEDRLTHMVNIERTIREIGLKANTIEEDVQIKNIKNNLKAKEELLSAIKYIDFDFNLTYQFILLGEKLDWIKSDDKDALLQKGMEGVLGKNNFSLSDKDLICSLDFKYAQLPLEKINLKNLYKNSFLVEAIGCLGAKSEKLLSELSKVVLSGERSTAFSAALILGRRNFYNEEIKNNLMLALKRPEVGGAATYPIGNFISLTDTVRINELASYIEDDSIGSDVIYVFAKLKPESVDLQLKLVHALKKDKLGNSASYALRECRVKNRAVKKAIKDLAAEGNIYAKQLL